MLDLGIEAIMDNMEETQNLGEAFVGEEEEKAFGTQTCGGIYIGLKTRLPMSSPIFTDNCSGSTILLIFKWLETGLWKESLNYPCLSAHFFLTGLHIV